MPLSLTQLIFVYFSSETLYFQKQKHEFLLLFGRTTPPYYLFYNDLSGYKSVRIIKGI